MTLASLGPSVATLLRRWTPESVRSRVSVRARARLRAWLALEPWPDLAVRHALFTGDEYRAFRERARLFDVVKPNKPVLERGHQTSFVLGRWFTGAGVRTAFQIGYANGRHLFYLQRMGIDVAGTDLPQERTAWVDVPADVFDATARRRLLRIDFFELTPADLRAVWPHRRDPVADLVFSEATFETLQPWRPIGTSVSDYQRMSPDALETLVREALPAKVAELGACARNFVFIEPEPSAGGAGAVFEAFASRLPLHAASRWRFIAPFDRLFRLSPRWPIRQVVYAFTRDDALLGAPRPYAEPM